MRKHFGGKDEGRAHISQDAAMKHMRRRKVRLTRRASRYLRAGNIKGYLKTHMELRK